VGPQHICDGLPTYSNWGEMQIQLGQFSTILSVKHEIVGKKSSCYVIRCICRWSRRRSHTIFSLPTIANNYWLACKVELSSTLQASRWSMPGTDYDSAINAQICCGGVPGCAGGYVSGHMRTRLSLAIGSRKSFRGFPSQTYVIL